MSFFEKAKQAADRAAEQARIAATEAGEQARVTAAGVEAQAKLASEKVSRGLTPERLADLIVKATYLQERTNAALKTKRSPYRVADIAVTATFPPQVGFTIRRMIDPVVVGDVLESTDILEQEGALGHGEAVLDLEPRVETGGSGGPATPVR